LSSVLSIDLGSQNLHIAERSFQKNILKINSTGVFPLPDGCVKGDTILNIDEIADTLINAIKTLGVKSKDVSITINAIGALTRDVELPMAKPKELEGMVKSELMQSYNLIDNHEIQYKSIRNIQTQDGAAMTRYRIFALELPTIESCYKLVRKLKKKPATMDVNINAIDKLLGITTQINEKPLGEAGTMFMDFGHHVTTIYIYAKNTPLFYRHLNVGSEEIEKIISEETLSSTADIKSLKEGGFNFFSEEEKAKAYFQYLRPYLYNFNDEMRKIIDFYADINNGVTVEQIYLFGGGSKLSGLSGYWESKMNVPVDVVQEISSLQLPQNQADLSLCLNSIGAIIRY